MAVLFYGTRDTYGCFSNFSDHGFRLFGRSWPTAEHCFQAQRFAGTPYEEQIRRARSPKEAKRLGRTKGFPIRRDWDSIRIDVMRAIVLRKFLTHEDLRHLLLSTGDAPIAENARYDFYWGLGADGSGRNMLGRILMEVREILRDEETTD